MSYRCGIGPGIPGLEPGPPRITCDACGRTLVIKNGLPPKWLLDGRHPPKWTAFHKDDGTRRDYCPDHTFESLTVERDSARAIARGLAFAYEHEVTPGIPFQEMLAAGLAFPAIPPRLR